MKLEKEMRIKRFEVDAKVNNIKFYNISDDEFKLIGRTYNFTRKIKPKNADELFKLYIYMVRHLLTSKSLIISRGTTIKTKTKSFYIINVEFINYHIKLNLFSNPYLKNYDDNILNKFEIHKPIRPVKQNIIQDDQFIDDDGDDKRYDISKNCLNHHLDDNINDNINDN
jgi:hypothetical protein